MKFVSLISSGIDSPVATYLVSKKAEEIILVHADIRPFTDNRENEKFIKLAKHIKNLVSCKVKAYILPHGNSLNTYKEICNNRFTCVFCKRMLLRYAEKIAEEEGADAIVMGDSLGQVASQTLQNLRTIEQAITIPVLRPLIGFDKEDTIKIAKEIGTYDLSILPTNGCNAVPHKPATRARLDQIIFEEKKIDFNKLLQKATSETKLLEL